LLLQCDLKVLDCLELILAKKSSFPVRVKLLGLCNILSSFFRRTQMRFSIFLKVLAAKLHLNLRKQFQAGRMFLGNSLKFFLPQNQSSAVPELSGSSLPLPNNAVLQTFENRDIQKDRLLYN